MTDLFDELQDKDFSSAIKATRKQGGDLLDELTAGEATLEDQRVEQATMDAQQRREFEEEGRRQQEIDRLNPFERFAVGAGRGLTTLGRGVGLVDQEDPATKEAFQRLEKESLAATVGEITGEAAPFIAAAPLAGLGAGAGALTSTGARVAAATGLGALEGGVIAKGKGGSLGQIITGSGTGAVISGAAEAVMPSILRGAGKLFNKLRRQPKGPLLTPDGTPTPELQKALDDTGTSFDDLTSKAFADTNIEGVNPEHAAREARFKEQGIPASMGDITQDSAQQATEQRLISQASGDGTEPLRQFKKDQSESFKNKIEGFIDELGVPDETGDAIKDAISGRKSLLTKEKNALYKEVSEATASTGQIPILTDSIIDAVPDKLTMEQVGEITGTQVGAIENALVRFGINSDPRAVAKFEGAGKTFSPLTLGNFDDFRKVLNAAMRGDPSGQTTVIAKPILDALDSEADIIAKSLEKSGASMGEDVLATLKNARQRVRELKTEFSPQSITGRLIDVKKDGVSPVIEASKISNELLKKSAPIENLQRTLSTLHKSGKEGIKAIKNLQASVVLNALEASLKAPSRKTDGVELVGGIPFAKVLSDLGDDKLKLLFKGNEKALNRLLNFKQTALDMSPRADAIPKGSASVILDVVNSLGRSPVLAPFRDGVRFVVNAGKDERAAIKAINAKPEVKRAMSLLERNFPNIASSLSIAGTVPLEGEK